MAGSDLHTEEFQCSSTDIKEAHKLYSWGNPGRWATLLEWLRTEQTDKGPMQIYRVTSNIYTQGGD